MGNITSVFLTEVKAEFLNFILVVMIIAIIFFGFGRSKSLESKKAVLSILSSFLIAYIIMSVIAG